MQKNYMFIYMEVRSHPSAPARIDAILTLVLYHQLCEGGDLHALIDKRVTDKDYLPEVKIWVIVAQLVSALHYMHNLLASDQDSFNILHRDVKPENSEFLPLPPVSDDPLLTLDVISSLLSQSS
jgi:serine/threonine protein kinase